MIIKEQVNGTLAITCAYAPRAISRFRGMGGTWNKSQSTWEFPATSKQMLTEYVEDQFGLGDPDTDVMVPETDAHDGQCYWHGYVLAERRSRDYSVKLVESSGCNMPFPSSGGSVKSPRVSAPDKALFALKVPRSFAEKHALIAPSTACVTDIAVSQLRKSERGQQTLIDFKAMMKNGADNLDSDNWAALLILTNEAACGKRDFIDTI